MYLYPQYSLCIVLYTKEGRSVIQYTNILYFRRKSYYNDIK